MGVKSDKNKKQGPTKSMDRKLFNRKPAQVQPIPRSNEVHQIVPLDNATESASDSLRRRREALNKRKDAKSKARAKMFRRDI